MLYVEERKILRNLTINDQVKKNISFGRVKKKANKSKFKLKLHGTGN